MTDDKKVDVIETENPAQDDGKDYKAMYEKAVAESRKWESRSKANAEKARKYDEMESAKKTLEERVSDIESRNRALENEKARNELVKAVSAVTGVPDPVRGKAVKATIVLADGFTPSAALTKELQTWVKRQTAPYKYPRIVEFRKDLPKTISGKIMRNKL